MVRRNSLLNDHRVIGAINETTFGVNLQVIDVVVKSKLFSFVLSKEDTRVVDEKALVHTFNDVGDVRFMDVAVNAASGNTGITDGLGLLGDTFGVEDSSTITENIEHPLKLHFSDAIGKLANEHTNTRGG